MRFVVSCLAAIAATGCGGLDCDVDDWSGTYLVTPSEHAGGTCGALTTYVIDADAELDPGCTLEKDRRSEDGCTTERTVTCISQGDNLRLSGAGVLHQQDDDGDRFEGVLTMNVRALDTGASVCTSTYDVVYDRQ